MRGPPVGEWLLSPLGRGYFPHDSRPFVPRYDHAVLGEKHILPAEALIKLALTGLCRLGICLWPVLLCTETT